MKKVKEIYKTFFDDFSFTLLCSTTIIIGVFLIYLIFAAVLFNNGISVLASNFFGSLLIIICLSMILGLISPFVYSLFACNGVLHSKRKEEVSYKSFLKTYLIGTRAPFNGQLQIWNTLLKSFLIFFGLQLVALMILSILAMDEGSAFKPLLDEISKLNPSSNNYFFDLEKVLADHADLIRTTSLFTNFFGLLISTYYFIHTISKHTMRYFLAPSLLNAPNRLVTYVYKATMKQHKKEYLSSYYKVLWPMTVLYGVTFALSYFLIGFLGPKAIDINVLSLTAMFISVCALVPFLPLVFNYHESIWPKFSYYFMQLFISNASRELNQAKKDLQNNSNFDKQNIDLAEKNIEKIKEAFDQHFKEFETNENEGKEPLNNEEPKEENKNESSSEEDSK